MRQAKLYGTPPNQRRRVEAGEAENRQREEWSDRGSVDDHACHDGQDGGGVERADGGLGLD